MPPPVRHCRFPLPVTSSWRGLGGRLLLGRLVAVDQRLEVRARPELRDRGRGHVDLSAGREVTRRAGGTLALLEGAETACRWLVKDRMDITGARWGLAGAEAVLKLRALYSAGDFDQYWNHHLRQEHQHIHQAKYRDSLQLAA